MAVDPQPAQQVPGLDHVRPVYHAVDAARLLGMSRYGVTQAIRRGRLEGFGFPREQRKRWFVFTDSVDARLREQRRNQGSAEIASEVASVHQHLPPPQPAGADVATGVSKDRDRYRADASTFREVSLRLNVALQEVHRGLHHRSQAQQHLEAALEEGRLADEGLRAALEQYGEAVAQLLTPSTLADVPKNTPEEW